MKNLSSRTLVSNRYEWCILRKDVLGGCVESAGLVATGQMRNQLQLIAAKIALFRSSLYVQTGMLASLEGTLLAAARGIGRCGGKGYADRINASRPA